jgi:hypothetical protein
MLSGTVANHIKLDSTMKAAIAIAGILGLGNVLSPLACINGCTGTEASMFAFAFVGGLCLIAVAYGMCRRLLWAWKLGFVAIVFGGIYFVTNAMLFPPKGPTGNVLTNLTIAAAMGIVVSVGLAYWWHQWRGRFGKGMESNPSMQSTGQQRPAAD